MPKAANTVGLLWNNKTLAKNKLIANWGKCVSQLHLAKMVELKDGSLESLRSRNQYNMDYRMFGNELSNWCSSSNQSLLNLFLDSADFDSLKTKWSSILAYVYRDAYTEDQYRDLLRGLRDMYLGNSTPGNMERSIQRMLRIDNNLVDVLEYWKDSYIMTPFLQNWLIRNDAVLLTTGTATSNSGADDLIDSGVLNGYADDDLVGFTVIITSGSGIGQVRKIISNDQSSSSLTVDPNWTTPPVIGDAYTISLFRHTRNNLDSLRPTLDFYTGLGLTNYGFQVWITVDDYLNAAFLIPEIIKKIRPAHTQYAIVYVLHKSFSGSLTAALLDPTKNPAFVAIGTGDGGWDPYNPQPTGSETALYSETSRQIGLINYIDDNEKFTTTPTRRLEVSGFFSPGVGTSTRVMEVGLFAEDGTTMLDYRAFSAIDKKVVDGFIWKFRMTFDTV